MPDIADACFDLVETGTSAMLNSLAVRRCFVNVTTHLARSEGCDPAMVAPVVGLLAGRTGGGPMTLRIPAASIPPDLRFGAADILADPATGDLIGDVTLHAQGCLPPWPAFPRYLRYADRETILVAEGLDELG